MSPSALEMCSRARRLRRVVLLEDFVIARTRGMWKMQGNKVMRLGLSARWPILARS